MEYIRNGRELCEQGFHITLGPYDYHVLLDFREIWDDEYGTWGKLCHQLDGRPAAEMDDEVKQIRYGALIDLFRQHIEQSASILTGEFAGLSPEELTGRKKRFASAQKEFFTVLARTENLSAEPVVMNPAIIRELEYLESVVTGEGTLLDGFTSKILAFTWLTLHRAGELSKERSHGASAEIVQRFGLSRPLEEELAGEAAAEGDSLAKLDVTSVMALLRILLKQERFILLSREKLLERLPLLLEDRDVAIFIGLHHSGGHKWFVKERWETMLQWLEFAAEVSSAGDPAAAETAGDGGRLFLVRAGKEAGYRVDRLLKVAGC
jgi:hypothetical protein